MAEFPHQQLAGGAGAAGAQASPASAALVCIQTPSRPRYYIVAKSALRRHVQIITIDPVSGALKFSQTYGRDMFPTETHAFDHLRHDGPMEIFASGKHLLGYVVIGHVGMVLMAEKVRVAAVLPGNHQVKTIVTSKWTRVPLQAPQLTGLSQSPAPVDPEAALLPAQREEFTRGIDKITTFPVDGAHYFCETIDLTRPFPSFRPVTQPSWEFVWNRWLTTSFRSVGLDFLCPPLLQGLCEERALSDFDALPYSVALISRRGRLHVGPRYKARGLNDAAEPANEIEVEQVIWRRPAKEGQPISWSRYTWRRGSVPLWWGVHMRNNGLGEAEIKIRETCTFRGSRRYVRRLQKRYCPLPILDPQDGGGDAAGQSLPAPHVDDGGSRNGRGRDLVDNAAAQRDPSLRVPVVFVSLLRKGTPDRDRSEAKLAAAFDFMSNAVRKEHALPLQYIAIDWHEMDKQLGSHDLVAAFWSTMRDILPAHKFALGTLTQVGADHADLAAAGLEPPAEGPYMPTQRCVSNAGLGWQARWFGQQRGLTRYNCADSLDRTNVGSFFGAVQVMVEQCRELDIAIAVSSRGVSSIVSVMKRQQVVAAAAAAAAAAGTGVGARAGVAPRTLATLSRSSVPSGSGAATPSASQPGNAGLVGSGLDKLGKLFTDLKVPKPSGGMAGGSGNQSAQALVAEHGASAGSMPDLNAGLGPGGRPGSASAVGTMSANVPRPSSAATAPLPRPPSPLTNVQAVLDEIARTLPPGWEVKIDNASEKLFYVDHNARATAWSHPSLSAGAVEELTRRAALGASGSMTSGPATPAGSMTGSGYATPVGGQLSNTSPPAPMHRLAASRSSATDVMDLSASSDKLRLGEEERDALEPLSPWCMLRASVKAFARRISPEALSALAELFLVNGDMSAWLYTGSQAMHSERILIFEPENSKLRKAGVGAYGNIMVGIKRRYNNVLMDGERQQQIEMFLGMRHAVYFPLTRLYYKEEAAVPLDSPETDDEGDQLGFIDWAPEKSTPGGFTPITDPANAGAPNASSKSRTKSYSSVDFLWDKLPGGSGRVARGALATAPPGGAVAIAAPDVSIGLHNARTSPGAAASQHADDAVHMHKAVSDPSNLNLLGLDLSDGQSDRSGALGHLGPGGHRLDRPPSVGRSASLGNLVGLDVGGTSSPSPSPSPHGPPPPPPVDRNPLDPFAPVTHLPRPPHLPPGLPLPIARAPEPQRAAGHSGGLPQLDVDMRHSYSTGQLAGVGRAGTPTSGAASPGAGYGYVPSARSAGATPERDVWMDKASATTAAAASAIKQGIKKLTDPLGLL